MSNEAETTESFPALSGIEVTLHDDGSVTISQTHHYDGDEETVSVDRVQLDWLVGVLTDHLKKHSVGA